MACLPAGPDAFFSVGPAETGKAQCFAVKRGDAVGRLNTLFNHPGYELLEARLDASRANTPELGELLSSIAGGATPKRSDGSLYADSGIKFLRILNIEDGEIIEQDMKYITPAVHQGELGRSQLEADDLLMTITGRVGSAAVVRREQLPANINQHIARLRVDLERCRPEFLSEWLNCPAGQQLSNRLVSGGTRPALDYGAIHSIRVPLPPIAEQEKLVTAMDAARAERKSKLAEADALLARLDNFVLDALGISASPEVPQRAFAIRGGGMTGLQLGPSRYAPELQTFLNGLRDHPSASQPLGAYVDINPQVDVSSMDAQEMVGFIPMGAVSDDATGDYTFEERLLEEVRKGYTPFTDGDILWAKITPCMQNGKSCIVERLPNGVGFGSTEFHILRVREEGVATEFVKEFVSQGRLRKIATYAFTGSAGQQRVPAEFLSSLPFPKVPEAQQIEIVEEIAGTRANARRLRAEAEAGWQASKQWFEEQLLG